MNKFLIYYLEDPFTYENRYVGRSSSGLSRPKDHFKPKNLKGNTHKENWIRGVMAKGQKPIIHIVEFLNHQDELPDAEQFWIAYFRSIGCRLTNATDGGEGTVGYKHTEETLITLREKALNRDKTPYQNPHNKKINVIENDRLHRQCAKCLELKEIENFSFKIEQKTYQGYCKSCNAVVNEEWRRANPLPTLSEQDYNASRLPGAIAGGEASKSPERREQARKQRSKAILATCITTGTTLTFESALKAKEAGFQNSNIGQAIKYSKPYKGYYWTFL